MSVIDLSVQEKELLAEVLKSLTFTVKQPNAELLLKLTASILAKVEAPAAAQAEEKEA